MPLAAARRCFLIAALLAAPLAVPPTFATDTPASETVPASARIVPVMVLDGEYPEVKTSMAFFDKRTTLARDLVAQVHRAREDKDVRALIVRIESPAMSLSTMQDLRRALVEFRASGKEVIASFESVGIAGYFLASAANRIVIGPVGSLELNGINAQSYFFKGALEKIGAQAEVVNTGRYKTAMEMFTHDRMSDGNREQISAVIEDILDDLAQKIADSRGIRRSKARDILTEGPYSVRKALSLGYVDAVGYIDDIEAYLNETHGVEVELDYEYGESREKRSQPPPNIFAMLMGGGLPKASRASDTTPRVAVVHAIGPIVDGRSESSPFGQNLEIASEDFIDLLDEVIEENSNLKAIVLRVDSPGGSAIASDRIWTRIQEIRAGGIPVIASMGDVAGSGGYYIAMGSDRILADATTITGSIGVVFGRITLGGTYQKLGITKDGIRIGKHSDLYDESKLWSEDQRRLLNEFVDEVYDIFTAKASQGRGLSQDRIKELGGGRIWSGTDAVQNGLVDEIGGLERAIEIARQFSESPDATVVYYPREKTFMEIIEEIFSGKLTSTTTVRALTQPDPFAMIDAVVPARQAHLARTLFRKMAQERPPALAVMTQTIDIR